MGSALYDRIGQGYTSTRRPDPRIAAAILDALGEARGAARLPADLDSGAWERRFGHLRALDSLDAGYRLVVAD